MQAPVLIFFSTLWAARFVELKAPADTIQVRMPFEPRLFSQALLNLPTDGFLDLLAALEAFVEVSISRGKPQNVAFYQASV
eukprot:8915957-Alexandrium_andersonii.AAC.1